jgi:hypothetical protein
LDIPAERQAYIDEFKKVASNPHNERPDLIEKDPNAANAGVKKYTESAPDGKSQTWVYVRNGEIVDAGINPPGKFR